MNYCTIQDEEKQHLLSLIDFLYKEVGGAGGDGDALWYSKYYDVADIKSLIEEYNSKTPFPWEIHYDKENKRLYWGANQEGMIITNNEELYKNAPSWQQILIKY